MQPLGTETTSRRNRTGYIIGALLVAMLLYFPYFLHLDSLPMQFWDESLFAMRAFAVAEHGEILHNFQDYGVEHNHPSTKPPLVTFLQAGCMKVFGYNVLAIRLPIALFAFGCSVMVILLVWRTTHNYLAAALGGVALATAPTWLSPHFARTGDQDVALAFFAFSAFGVLWFYLEKGDFRWNRTWTFFLLLLLGGFLTKSLAVFLFLPGIALYLAIRKDTRVLFRKRFAYLSGLLVLLLPIVGYFLTREAFYPGFWERTWSHDLGGRYLEVVDGHSNNPFTLVWENILAGLGIWLFWFLPLWILAFDKKTQRFAVYATCGMLGTLIVLMLGKTQLGWYYAPMYCYFALMIGLGSTTLFSTVREIIATKNSKYVSFALGLLLFISITGIPYLHAIERVYKRTDLNEEYASYEYFIRWSWKNRPNERIRFYTRDRHVVSFYFFKNVAAAENKPEIDLIYYTTQTPAPRLQINDTVCTCVEYNWVSLRELYEVEKLDHPIEHCYLFKITGYKNIEGT